LILVRTC